MKKTTLRDIRYYFVGGFCLSSVIMLFFSENKLFPILVILSFGSYLLEPLLERFLQSQTKFGFSLLGSAVRSILLGLILDCSFREKSVLSAFEIIDIVALAGTFLLVVCFSIQAFKTSLSVTSGTIMLLNLMLIYALLYDAIYYIDPLAFSGTSGFCSFPFIDFIYYSIVTFTTLGYGDIVPATIVTKLLSASEAFIFTCMIAFVVMNFGKQLNEKKAKIVPNDTSKKSTKE